MKKARRIRLSDGNPSKTCRLAPRLDFSEANKFGSTWQSATKRDPHHFAGPEQVIRFNLDGIFNIPEDKHEHPADDATRNHEQTSSAGFC
ncbi:hypothetical protein PGTUg99_011215 [Puccinia graminis f. sp. tritici]|uniref:Uncharacterized protein n=1 Tax=Puccinia graminis f. sp. tritici TaxID=56615 RepID=A0A5B0NW38_PUCGR|nr:hypothetical protein PGTUg99_011215 [Puccinia graminis f. sp. tritici]